jgi:hypothetical protein
MVGCNMLTTMHIKLQKLKSNIFQEDQHNVYGKFFTISTHIKYTIIFKKYLANSCIHGID